MCGTDAFARRLYDRADAWDPGRAEDIAEELEAYITEVHGDTASLRYSFDVFDTILLRDDRSEEERLYEVSGHFEQAFGGPAQVDVFTARLQAHAMAKRLVTRHDGVAEAPWDLVVDLMLHLLDAPASAAEPVTELETVFELASLRPNPYLRAFVERVAPKEPILLISDMYLPPAVISVLVESCWDLDYRLHVSSERGLTKRGGGLFDVARTAEIGDLENVVHLGDDHLADVVSARVRGFDAVHLPVPRAIAHRRREARAGFLTRFHDTFGVSVSELA
jgi:hypothetical protein